MKQDEQYILARDQVRKVINFSRMLGGNRSSTYGKSTGGIFNGVRNPDLTSQDIQRLQSVVSEAEVKLKDYKTQLKRISKK